MKHCDMNECLCAKPMCQRWLFFLGEGGSLLYDSLQPLDQWLWMAALLQHSDHHIRKTSQTAICSAFLQSLSIFKGGIKILQIKHFAVQGPVTLSLSTAWQPSAELQANFPFANQAVTDCVLLKTAYSSSLHVRMRCILDI